MFMKNAASEILKEYEKIQDISRKDLERKKTEIYNVIPQIKEIDEKISSLSVRIARDVIGNLNNSNSLLNDFQKEINALNSEKMQLLLKFSYPEDYLTLQHKCSLCKDTGYVENSKCKCFKQKLIEYAYNQSNLTSLLSSQNFETFNFEYYSDEINSHFGISPKKNIQNIYKTCIDFVKNFDVGDENLLFTGTSGLGKTFLSSCIAKDLLDNGYTIFYQTAHKIFDILEEFKFNKDKNFMEKPSIDILFDVDLLIIDDLGTEFVNSYINSELFNVLNSRLLQKKKTLISTNLNLDDLFKLYSERITSRIWGHYKVLEFFGDDIRQKNSINLV